MTEISQSHGTLNSTIEESSTPSNNSEYFSVTSSLDILNCNDEVYYSMDEEMEKEVQEIKYKEHLRYECRELKKENAVDCEDLVELILSNNDDVISEMFINDHLVNSEDWDKVCDNLNSVISQESVSTDEDDDPNNYSAFSESIYNHSSVERHDSDNEENVLFSVNNATQMTSSVIEGELSELNDIAYESSLSQDPCVTEEDDVSLKAEDKTENIAELELSILEMVRKIEFSELELDESTACSVKEKENESVVEECEIIIENLKFNKPIPKKNKIKESNDVVEQLDQKLQDRISVTPSKLKITEESSKSKQVDIIEESPIKTSALCCSIKRRKVKSNQPKSKPSKSKSLFSFLRFYKKEKVELKSPKSLPQLNVSKEKEDLYVMIVERDEYQCIPFIDADVGIYSDSYIPLAKHEVFNE